MPELAEIPALDIPTRDPGPVRHLYRPNRVPYTAICGTRLGPSQPMGPHRHCRACEQVARAERGQDRWELCGASFPAPPCPS